MGAEIREAYIQSPVTTHPTHTHTRTYTHTPSSPHHPREGDRRRRHEEVLAQLALEREKRLLELDTEWRRRVAREEMLLLEKRAREEAAAAGEAEQKVRGGGGGGIDLKNSVCFKRRGVVLLGRAVSAMVYAHTAPPHFTMHESMLFLTPIPNNTPL